MSEGTKPKKVKHKEKLAWKKKGHKGDHEGTHEYLRGSRLFVLTSETGKRIEFSSHQAAKRDGWVGGR